MASVRAIAYPRYGLRIVFNACGRSFVNVRMGRDDELLGC